jgi:hypothetical protein
LVVEREVAQARQRGEARDQARQLVAQQRLAARDADLLGAELDELSASRSISSNVSSSGRGRNR